MRPDMSSLRVCMEGVHGETSCLIELKAMRLRLRAIFLLMAIFWQSLSVLAPLTVATRATEMTHLAVHGQDADHHHHDDQALHMEEADEPMNHIHADAGFNTSGLLSTHLAAVTSARPLSPAWVEKSMGLSPFLDGPLRPPMHTA
jgi:hypothetical protein